MSVTIAHRPHIQLSWLSIVVVVIVAAAALVAVMAIQADTTTTTTTPAQAAGTQVVPGPALDLPRNQSPAIRALIFGTTGAPQAPSWDRRSPHAPRLWEQDGGR